MPTHPASRPGRATGPVKTLQRLVPAARPILTRAAAALRPILPTHAAGTANHARHHVPVKAQS